MTHFPFTSGPDKLLSSSGGKEIWAETSLPSSGSRTDFEKVGRRVSSIIRRRGALPCEMSRSLLLTSSPRCSRMSYGFISPPLSLVKAALGFLRFKWMVYITRGSLALSLCSSQRKLQFCGYVLYLAIQTSSFKKKKTFYLTLSCILVA